MIIILCSYLLYVYFIFFFFSSRRRHTRYWRDWSSDVCSSDLLLRGPYVSVSMATSGTSLTHRRHSLALSSAWTYEGCSSASCSLGLFRRNSFPLPSRFRPNLFSSRFAGDLPSRPSGSSGRGSSEFCSGSQNLSGSPFTPRPRERAMLLSIIHRRASLTVVLACPASLSRSMTTGRSLAFSSLLLGRIPLIACTAALNLRLSPCSSSRAT